MKKLFVTIILLLSFGSTWAIDITLEKILKEVLSLSFIINT